MKTNEGRILKQYIPRTAPTVTFAGDRRLQFSWQSLKGMGCGKVQAVKVYTCTDIGLLIFQPTKDKSCATALILAARGKEKNEHRAYAKRLYVGGILQLFPSKFSWEALKGKTFLLVPLLVGTNIMFAVDLTSPVN